MEISCTTEEPFEENEKVFQESALTLLRFSNQDLIPETSVLLPHVAPILIWEQARGEPGDLNKTHHQGVQAFLPQKEAVISTFKMSSILKAVEPNEHAASVSRDSKSCKGSS